MCQCLDPKSMSACFFFCFADDVSLFFTIMVIPPFFVLLLVMLLSFLYFAKKTDFSF